MHHPKLFAALLLSLSPAYEVYTITSSTGSIDPVGLGCLSFLVFSILIYATLALREGVRQLQALRALCEQRGLAALRG